MPAYKLEAEADFDGYAPKMCVASSGNELVELIG